MGFQTLPPCLSLRDNVRAYYNGIYRCTITSPAGAIQLVKKISSRKKYRRLCQKIKALNLPTKFRPLRPQNVFCINKPIAFFIKELKLSCLPQTQLSKPRLQRQHGTLNSIQTPRKPINPTGNIKILISSPWCVLAVMIPDIRDHLQVTFYNNMQIATKLNVFCFRSFWYPLSPRAKRGKRASAISSFLLIFSILSFW